mgnify:CR=1 FL=1
MLRRIAAILAPLAVLAGLILLSFAPVLRAPGIVGHVWDWGVPNFAEQFSDMARHHFSTWDAYFETGRYHYFKLELLYWLAITPFSVLGGAFMSKWLPILMTFFAGASMLALARNRGLTPFYATLACVFYALSPYAFSRTAAGHLPMLAGYALSPLIILSGLTLLDRLDEKRPGGAYFTVLTGFLLGLCSLHPGVGVSAAALLTILFGCRFLSGRRRLPLAASFLTLCAVAVLMNIHFMAPFAGDYFGKGAIRHGWGLSVSAEGDVTVDTELPRREAYHQSASQPADASAFLRLRPGMDTEYAYPVPEALAPVWNLAALFLSLCVFAYAFSGKRRRDLTGLFVAAVIGVLLVSGSRTIFGYAFYQGALKNVLPILFAAFSNTTRWLPLIILPYAVLAFHALQDAAPAGGRRAAWLKSAAVLALGIFIWPYVSGALLADYDHETVPQPLTLKVTPIHPDDAKVYAFLRDQRELSRAVYLPAIGITWPGETEHAFEWSSAYSPKPFFLAFATNPLGEGILERMYSEYPSRRLGRLFGLASARYLIYPRYGHAYTYIDYQPGYKAPAMVDGYKDYKPVLDAALAMQEDVTRLPLFGDVEIIRNEDFLPLVRPGSRTAAVEKVSGPGGNVTAAVLPELVELPDYDPGVVYVRAGRDPEFLKFLDGMMGPGKRGTRVLFDRKEKRETVIMTPEDKLPVPALEFRRLGPTRLRVRVHGATAGFPLVFQETFHPGWKAALVPMKKRDPDKERAALLALAQKAAPFAGNERDQAVGEELAGLVRQGLVTTLGDGAGKSRRTYVYGRGGRVIADNREDYAVDFVSKPEAGSIQNDNLPDADLFATLNAGTLVMASEASVAQNGRTTPEIPDPLDPDVWSVSGADGVAPVLWPDLFHLDANGFANCWWMDPAILSKLPEAGPDTPGYYARNPDGSYDFEALLDFGPQKFYLIGLMASGAVMAACLIYLAVFGLWGLFARSRASRAPGRAHG